MFNNRLKLGKNVKILKRNCDDVVKGVGWVFALIEENIWMKNNSITILKSNAFRVSSEVKGERESFRWLCVYVQLMDLLIKLIIGCLFH